ncbi:MAG: helix-turn-helix domain-containing protein [Candidatus Gastranaerophilales bacterium]|nr:helix-turn-helix domain-containing protein [Candidatus Gastranaerophilales bacterium]MCM1073244.1 helix-turn-helix domain-containing protein [Bacteroides sp.]
MQERDERLNRLGKHIRYLRTKHKITLENLCYKNGLEPSTVSRIEKGLVEPKFLTLLRLAEAFNLTISELLDFEI